MGLVVKFINSLESKGIVETVSKSVTHIVVGTDADLRAQRTTKYLMGIAAGRLIVSHKWIEACLRDPKNLLNAKDFEVTDAELDGANGPWKARIACLACYSPILKGFEIFLAENILGFPEDSFCTL